MMNLTNKKDAAKKVFCRGAGSSSLLRSFGALLLAVCLLAAIPMDAAAAGGAPDPAPTDVISENGSDGADTPEGEPDPTGTSSETGEAGSNGYEVVLLSGVEETEAGELWQFRKGLTITSEDGTEVQSGGIVYTGSKYTIHLKFQEGGAQGLQMLLDGNGQLHYQLPGIFETTAMERPLTVTITDESGNPHELQIGTISVDEKGMVTVQVAKEYQYLFASNSKIYDLGFSVDIEGTAGELQKGEDYKQEFDGAGEDFWVQVMDHPKVTAEKKSKFTENEDHKGGKLEYTVTTKVEHGQLNDGEITDVLTPPNNTDAFTLEMVTTEGGQPDVKVTLKRDGKEIILGPDDYDLIPVTNTPDGKQTFKVQLKGERCNPLLEGDELDVTYRYDATLDITSLNEFWGNVENEVTVTGHMPVEKPQEKGEMIDVPVEEHAGSNEEIRVTHGGHGVVSKTQEYSEATKTLHYTLYTVIPAGKWTPLYIYDDMYVEYGGKKWYIQEFKEDGRVKNLTVSAKDVEGWTSDWDSMTDKEKAEYVKSLGKEGAKKVNVFSFDGWSIPDGYIEGPTNRGQCARYFNGKGLYVVFGLEKPEDWNSVWGKWGHWDYGTDRLIITEYDLDLSSGDPLELSEMGGSEKMTMTPEQVLQTGITNNVYLRYSGYYPGYSVYFNNAEKMNKTGEVNAEDNTITWTVTMNTTDTTVSKYFRDVFDDVYANHGDWGSGWYSNTMQAAFYDVLPEDWEYVEGSLSVTTNNKGATQTFFYPDNLSPLTEDRGAIDALLVVFRDDVSGNPNKELFNMLGANLRQLTFTYKLKPTEKWLAEHQYKLEGFEIDNHAEIKDENFTHWEADAEVTYFPPQLTKKAEVIGKGVLKFTLEVNPQGVKLGIEDTLTVEDTSENLIIDPTTIEVKDKDGNEVAFKKTVEDGHFTLEVPNGQHLFITYMATIDGDGNEKISNTASIEGVVGGDSSYSNTFDVNNMTSGGAGTTYSMTVRKVDASDDTKQLAGAVFDYYMVLKQGATQQQTDNITVGGKEYSCYKENGMTVTTETDGGKASTLIEPGNYYIFVETTAPEGYLLDPTPILVYFGEALPTDAPEGTRLVEPRGEYTWLTIPNTPVKNLQVVKTDAASDPEKTDYFLGGAVFELRDESGNVLYTGTSLADTGVIEWNGTEGNVTELHLDAGTYFLVETDAPEGYIKLADPVQFTVDANGNIELAADAPAGVVKTDGTPTVTITVPNQSGYVLPESGGMGTTMLYALGAAFILTASLALVCDARRRKSRN